jgi:hypothetical protein
MSKDVIIALDMGMRIIGMFIFCLYVGYKLDLYFQMRPICITIGVLLAFSYVMKLLLGVGKHG